MYHGANGMRPDLVPVGGDFVAGLCGSRELERTRRAVVVARNRGVSGVGDGVATGQVSSAPSILLLPHKAREQSEVTRNIKGGVWGI